MKKINIIFLISIFIIQIFFCFYNQKENFAQIDTGESIECLNCAAVSCPAIETIPPGCMIDTSIGSSGCPVCCPGLICSSSSSGTVSECTPVCGSGCRCRRGKPTGLCEALLCCKDSCDECKCPKGTRFSEDSIGSSGSCIINEGHTVCTKEFNPVCGCDGMTYGNPCTARARGIKKFTEGQCIKEDDCKCPDGFSYLDGMCTNKQQVACILLFAPVCGCDGMTYDNSCFANASGVKSYTDGECTSSSSSSGNLACTSDNDCPIGICPNGDTYMQFSCIEGMCSELIFIRNPCEPLGTSSSGGITIGNEISGTWKGTPSTVSNDCVVCPQVLPLCEEDSEIIPQTCTECAHCAQIQNTRKRKNPELENKVLLKLCFENNILRGFIKITNLMKNGEIISSSIIGNQVNIEILDSNGNTFSGIITLTSEKTLELKINELTYSAKKVNRFGCKKINNSCPLPFILCAAPPPGCEYVQDDLTPGECPTGCGNLVCSSSGDCSPKGSCRGENGENLECPQGTECSGLPAYGCYPPGCPVPICLSPIVKIKTGGEQVRVADLMVGDTVLSDNEKPAKVIKVSKVPVENHRILHIVFNDASTLDISPGHPTADGRKFNDLKMGDVIDKRMITMINLVNYNFKYTYDILPDSTTGNYYANGILIGSTLK